MSDGHAPSEADLIVSARAAITEAHYHLNSARERLQRAHEESTYDTWLGGFFSSIRKVLHLERSNDSLRNVGLSLTTVSDALVPLGHVLPETVGMVRFRESVEVWLDNPVTDVMTARRVKRALAQVDRIAAHLVRLDSELGRRLVALTQEPGPRVDS